MLRAAESSQLLAKRELRIGQALNQRRKLVDHRISIPIDRGLARRKESGLAQTDYQSARLEKHFDFALGYLVAKLFRERLD